jgi:hypothetical protein
MRAHEFITEASYKGNVGFMEVMKFYQSANEDQVQEFQGYMEDGDTESAWELIQQVTGTKLIGKEFDPAPIQEIEYDPTITKRSMGGKRDMQFDYKKDIGDTRSSRNVDKISRYDIPELPDHTIEVVKDGRETIVYLVSDVTNEALAVIRLSISDFNSYQVDGVKIIPEFQGKNIGQALYKFIIVDLGYPLMSGETQSPGSAKLWTKLAMDNEIQVKAYNLSTGKYSSVVRNPNSGLLSVKNLKKYYNDIYSDDDIVLIAKKR